MNSVLTTSRMIAASASLLMGSFFFSSSIAIAFSLKDYNLIVFDDLDLTSEVEGNTFIGGNLTGSGNFAIVPQSLDTGADTLIVGGNINGNFNINNGNVRYGGTQSGNLNLNGQNSQAIFDPTVDISSLENELKQVSTNLADMASTGTNQLPSNQPAPAKLVSSGNRFEVFNIDGNSLFGSNLVQQIELIVNGSEDTILINVSGTNINWNTSNFVGEINQDALQQKVIWNFYEATNLTFQRQFQGSLLAPLATLDVSSPIEGSVAVNNFNMNSEIHLPIFNGQIETVPEPVSILGAATALGFGVILKNKSTKK